MIEENGRQGLNMGFFQSTTLDDRLGFRGGWTKEVEVWNLIQIIHVHQVLQLHVYLHISWRFSLHRSPKRGDSTLVLDSSADNTQGGSASFAFLASFICDLAMVAFRTVRVNCQLTLACQGI
jgi:hypothetical protein